MVRPIRTLLAVSAMTIVLAGCGGGHANGTRPVTLGNAIGECLNGDGFSVSSTPRIVNGVSPAGVAFTLRLYGTAAAARRAFARTSPTTASLVGRGVVDVAGNPPSQPGAPPARLAPDELRTVRACVVAQPGK